MSSLLESWVEAGQDFRAFWPTSLKEIRHVINGHVNRMVADRQTVMWAAWHTAFFTAYAPQKSRKFWKLKDVMPGAKPERRQQSVAEQIAIAEQWTKAIERMRRG